jgi:hypothetical protein
VVRLTLDRRSRNQTGLDPQTRAYVPARNCPSRAISVYRGTDVRRIEVGRSLGVVLVLSVFGCSSSTAGGKNVRIETADPPPSCEQISVITASGSNTGNDDATVREKLRERAAARDANYVRLDKLGGTSTLKEYTGTAFRCPAGT